MRKIKNTLLACLIAIFALAITTGIVATPKTTANAATINVSEYRDTEAVKFGDQSPDAPQYDVLWFTLSASDYVTVNAGKSAAQIKALNWGEKVKFTIDGQERTLSECFTDSTDALSNLYGRTSVIAIRSTTISDYKTIEKVTVEAGCEFPSEATSYEADNVITYKTTQAVTFENNGDGTFIGYRDTTFTSFGDFGGEVQKNGMFVSLSNNDYDSSISTQPVSISSLNVERMVSYVGSDGVSHTMVGLPGQRFINLFDRHGSFAFWDTGISDYTKFQSVTVEAGCEFPSYYSSVTNPNCTIIYRTTETVTLTNNGTAVWYPDEPEQEEQSIDTSVTSVSLALNGGSTTDYFLNIVLSENDYAGQNTLASRDARNRLNVTEYILIDDQPASIVDASEAFINVWGLSDSFATRLPNPDASQINKITIKAGCKFPSVAMVTDGTNKYYITTEDVTFTRRGDAFMRENTYRDTSVALFGDPDVPGGGDTSILWFTLSEKDYTNPTTIVNMDQIKALNLGDKVKFKFRDESERTLRECFIENTAQNTDVHSYLFGRRNAPLGIRFTQITDYTTQLESVTIEAGCEFPSQATASFGAGGGYVLYRTTEAVTFDFYNNGVFMKPNTYNETEVTAFGDPGDLGDGTKATLWFTLSTHDYSGAVNNPTVNDAQLSALNLKSKIKFKFQNDEKEYTLSEYMATKGLIGTGFFNLYVRPNVFALRLEEVSNVFDYTKLEWITIEENCDFPSFATSTMGAGGGFTLYRTTEAVTFDFYGNGAFMKPNTYRDTSVASFGDPDVPAGGDRSILWFTLSENDYTTVNTIINMSQIRALNLGDKIKLKFFGDATEHTLREYFASSTDVHAYLYQRLNAPLGIRGTRIADYATELVSVTIEAGCDFPSAATNEMGAGGGYILYRTTDTVTFINIGNGIFATPQEAREKAKGELASYKDKSDYRAAEQAEIDEILSDAYEQIEDSDSWAEMSEVVEDAKAKLDAVKTDEQLSYEEEQAKLPAAKEEAKATLRNYKDKTAYREEEQAKIDEILENAEDEIDACERLAAIEEVVSKYKKQLDALKTDADYKADGLIPAKKEALDRIGELKASLDVTKYSDENLVKISELYRDATHGIENAESEEEIAEIVAEFEKAIGEIPEGREEPDPTPGGDDPSEDDDNPSDDKGSGSSCAGNIGGLSPIFALLALAACAILLKKKIKNN